MSDRVEVELTPRSSARRRRRRDVATTVSRPGPAASATPALRPDERVPDVQGEPPSTSGRDRRAWIATVAVGLVALGVGWLLGRAGDGAGVADGPTPSTVVTQTSVAGATLPSVVPPPEPESATETSVLAAPPLTRPPPTTLAIDPDPPIRIAERLLGRPYEIVTLAPGRTLLEIDLLAGLVESRTYDQVVLGEPALYIGEDWALILTAFEARPSILFEGDADPRATEIFGGNNAPVVARPGEEFFWAVDGEIVGGRLGTATELDRTGAPTGRTLELTQMPRTIDPRGGVVVEIPGGTFSIGVDGLAERITSGRMLAISAESALVQECDDQLRCEYVVIDRSSGERTPVPLPPELAVTQELWGEDWWNVASPFSPDGTAAALVWHRPDSAVLVVLELVTGELVEMAQIRGPMAATWSPDGAYLFFLDGTRLRAWERASGDLFDVVDVPVDVGIGVREAPSAQP